MSLIFIRLDKIGDLIASMSVDQHSALQNEEITWVISKGLAWIPQSGLPSRKHLEIPSSKNNWQNAYKNLLNFLRDKKPRGVVVLYAPWWVSLACWRAKVPLRVGRLSQWHSFLFFNRRLRQTRSLSEKHENDYNLELIEYGLSLVHEKIPYFKMKIDGNPGLLSRQGVLANEYVVVHPGMFGSALNWPQAKYNELIARLSEKNMVLVTGTKNDERFLTEIKPRWQGSSRVKILQDQLSFDELLSLLSTAKYVVAPSTGVLHLAAALGKKCVGIYSPILAHHPRRWGPLGSKAGFLLPNVNCPAKNKCLEYKCPHYPCMNSISVESVLSMLESSQHSQVVQHE